MRRMQCNPSSDGAAFAAACRQAGCLKPGQQRHNRILWTRAAAATTQPPHRAAHLEDATVPAGQGASALPRAGMVATPVWYVPLRRQQIVAAKSNARRRQRQVANT